MAIAWRELFAKWHAAGGLGAPRFEPGATEEELRDAEAALGRALPVELRSLLAASNGVMQVLDNDGARVDTGWAVWPLREMVEERLASRSRDDGPPDDWLIFVNAGTDGILFGMDEEQRVWAWTPLEQDRQLLSASLLDFLETWLTGNLALDP